MKILQEAITAYLLWMISSGYSNNTLTMYERILNHFLSYAKAHNISWDRLFTVETEKRFKSDKGLTKISRVLRGFSKFLYEQNKILSPIKELPPSLPQDYEEYLKYYKDTKQVHPSHVQKCRRILYAFNDYLNNHGISFKKLKIEQVDIFLSNYSAKYSQYTVQNQRSYIRRFLSYLFYERKVLSRNLAPFIVGGPQFAEKTPPKFLRPQEIQRLFAGLETDSPVGLRTTAIIHLAYSLGLRPKEISRISLDDISFVKNEIAIPDRKSNTPLTLPLPEMTIKYIAAYIIGGRPKSTHRKLFLNTKAPYIPLSAGSISHSVAKCMKKANLPSSAYWLRHTYAQNLLEQGTSIFEIKQMMGHARIQTSRRYIKIHTKLMRKVLFDETL